MNKPSLTSLSSCILCSASDILVSLPSLSLVCWHLSCAWAPQTGHGYLYECGAEWSSHFPPHAGNTLVNTAQYAVAIPPGLSWWLMCILSTGTWGPFLQSCCLFSQSQPALTDRLVLAPVQGFALVCAELHESVGSQLQPAALSSSTSSTAPGCCYSQICQSGHVTKEDTWLHHCIWVEHGKAAHKTPGDLAAR